MKYFAHSKRFSKQILAPFNLLEVLPKAYNILSVSWKYRLMSRIRNTE